MGLRAVASGRVQGVGYRGYIASRGAAHSLSGYAENRPDGTVEIVAEGEAADLTAFLEEAWASDDPMIAVRGIEAEVTEATGRHPGFSAHFGDRDEEYFRRSGFALDLLREILRTEQALLAEQRRTNELLRAIVQEQNRDEPAR
ncbi:hypothetical protein CUJ86_04070 [Methanofollis fontis]|uniref:acylphosphatase n=2 Tax=Methanofollis fontis TaxID=2052832 RepID=A0A483CPS6_9EURY|nr:hypothetical protein CUJ86_04070 [Methanofollis fontis]